MQPHSTYTCTVLVCSSCKAQAPCPSSSPALGTQNMLMRIYTWMLLPGHAWERPTRAFRRVKPTYEHYAAIFKVKRHINSIFG